MFGVGRLAVLSSVWSTQAGCDHGRLLASARCTHWIPRAAQRVQVFPPVHFALTARQGSQALRIRLLLIPAWVYSGDTEVRSPARTARVRSKASGPPEKEHSRSSRVQGPQKLLARSHFTLRARHCRHAGREGVCLSLPRSMVVQGYWRSEESKDVRDPERVDC